MSKKTKTQKHDELVFLVDRSGSMSNIAEKMKKSIKEILDGQKNLPQPIKVTHIQFDTDYEECFHEKLISEVTNIPLEPRGGTALIDSFCTMINTVEKRYLEKEESDRPSKILFVIVTDGDENSSHEFNWEMAKNLKDRCEKYYGWDVTLMGTSESILDGGRLGIDSSKTITYEKTDASLRQTTRSVSNYATSYFSTGSATYEQDDK